MHNTSANAKHIILPVTLAIHSSITDTAVATDGLNELLNSSIEANFLADYKFDHPLFSVASSDPEEGSIFNKPKAANLCMEDVTTEDKDMKIVWVSVSESLSSGSFDWYPKEEHATEAYLRDKKEILNRNLATTQQFLFSYAVSKDLSNDEITDEIDGFIAERSRKGSFVDHPATQSYPYSGEAWDDIVRIYDEAYETM